MIHLPTDFQCTHWTNRQQFNIQFQHYFDRIAWIIEIDNFGSALWFENHWKEKIPYLTSWPLIKCYYIGIRRILLCRSLHTNNMTPLPHIVALFVVFRSIDHWTVLQLYYLNTHIHVKYDNPFETSVTL